MVLYSEPLLDIAGQYMEGQVVTVHNVVATLARLLTIKQCRLFGYLSLDGKLVFLIAPMDPLPSDVQVGASSRCGHHHYVCAQRDADQCLNHVLSTIIDVGLHFRGSEDYLEQKFFMSSQFHM